MAILSLALFPTAPEKRVGSIFLGRRRRLLRAIGGGRRRMESEGARVGRETDQTTTEEGPLPLLLFTVAIFPASSAPFFYPPSKTVSIKCENRQ